MDRKQNKYEDEQLLVILKQISAKESEAFDLLGNTVCVPVITAIAERLADMYKN